MAITEVFAGIAVTDRDAAVAWYERVVGRPPDLIPNANEAAWQLAATGWIYLVGDPERAGRSQLTVLVDDLDDALSGLTARGIDPGPVDTIPGAVRRFSITDPDGNTLQYGQPAGRA